MKDYCDILWENRYYIKEIENTNMNIDFAYGFGFACLIFALLLLFLYLKELKKKHLKGDDEE